MWTLLKTIFAIGGGPVAWFSTAVGFLYDAFKWCVDHWVLTLSIIATCLVFYGGIRYERSGWETKWAARDAKDKADEEQRIRTNLALDAAYLGIEGQAQTEAAARQVEYQKFQERLKAYEANHSGPVPAGDSCRAVDIGDDGLQLINDAIRSRHAGTDQRH